MSVTKDCNNELTAFTYFAASSGLLCDGPFGCSSSMTDCKKYMCKNVVFAQGLKVLVPKQQRLISQCEKTYDGWCYASKAANIKNVKS